MLLSELFEKKEMSEDELLQASSHEITTFSSIKQGLPSISWICEIKGYPYPVLKVSNEHTKIALQNNFIILVSKNPKLLTPNLKSTNIDIKPFFDWIKLNYSILKKYWDYFQTGDKNDTYLYKKLKSILPLNEMANFYSKITGIPYIIWIGKTEQHTSLRIKVSNIVGKFDNSFVVSISQNPEIIEGKSEIPPKDLKNVFEWVKLNYDILKEMANIFDTNQIDQSDKIDKLKTQIKSIKPKKNKSEEIL